MNEELRSILQLMIHREVALTAEVFMLRDFVMSLAEQHPLAGLESGAVRTQMDRIKSSHHEKLLIQLENENPSLAALLSSWLDEE